MVAAVAEDPFPIEMNAPDAHFHVAQKLAAKNAGDRPFVHRQHRAVHPAKLKRIGELGLPAETFVHAFESVHVQRGAVEVLQLAGEIGSHHALVQTFDNSPELRLAFAQRCVGPLALGDVAQDHGVDALSRHFELRYGRLNRELLPIDADPAECAERTHGARGHARGSKAPHVLPMPLAKTRGNEHGDGLPDCVRRRTPEHLFGGGVEQHDALLLVDADDRIHGGVDDAFHPRLAFPQRGFVEADLGHIASYFGESPQLALLVVDRRDQDVGPEPRSVLTHAPALIEILTLGDRHFQFPLRLAARRCPPGDKSARNAGPECPRRESL